MRWLIVTDDYPPLDGGVSTWTQLVAEALAERHEVTVLARSRPGLPARTGGARVVPVPGPSFRRWGSVWSLLRGAPHLRRVDCVLATTWRVALGLAPVCERLGVPVQVVLHGSEVTRPSPSEWEKLQHLLRRVDTVWCVSRFLADRLAEHGISARVLPAPTAPRDVGFRSPAKPQRWCCIARALPQKGGDRFVRLVAEARVEGTVFGAGPALESWRSEARNLGAEVQFRGRVPRSQLLEELPSYDLNVLLPRLHSEGGGEEGFGLALVEGASCGVPALGTQIGGVPEALGPGLCVLDPDDVEATLARLRAWWTPERGREAWEWLAAHHGPERVTACLEARARVGDR